MATHLYRALRPDEIASGCILIPKSIKPFKAHPRLPNVLPFILDERIEHAIREHQLEGNYRTRGVSCTTDWEVALRYAQSNRVIVAIDSCALEQNGIRRITIREVIHVELIEHPEDDECVLVSETNGPLPSGIILSRFCV